MGWTCRTWAVCSAWQGGKCPILSLRLLRYRRPLVCKLLHVGFWWVIQSGQVWPVMDWVLNRFGRPNSNIVGEREWACITWHVPPFLGCCAWRKWKGLSPLLLFCSCWGHGVEKTSSFSGLLLGWCPSREGRILSFGATQSYTKMKMMVTMPWRGGSTRPEDVATGDTERRQHCCFSLARIVAMKRTCSEAGRERQWWSCGVRQQAFEMRPGTSYSELRLRCFS